MHTHVIYLTTVEADALNQVLQDYKVALQRFMSAPNRTPESLRAEEVLGVRSLAMVTRLCGLVPRIEEAT